MFVLHHVTYSINSICHVFGRRSFDTRDESRNVFWLALPSFGEAWHNNHHAFPTSARHGLSRFEIDPSALVIRGLEAVGWHGTWSASAPSASRARPCQRTRAAVREVETWPSRARPPPTVPWQFAGRAVAVITGLTLLLIVDVRDAAFYLAWALIVLALLSEAAATVVYWRRARRAAQR